MKVFYRSNIINEIFKVIDEAKDSGRVIEFIQVDVDEALAIMEYARRLNANLYQMDTLAIKECLYRFKFEGVEIRCIGKKPRVHTEVRQRVISYLFGSVAN